MSNLASVIFIIRDKENRIEKFIRRKDILKKIEEGIKKKEGSRVEIYIIKDSQAFSLSESKLKGISINLSKILENSKNIYFLVLDNFYNKQLYRKIIDVLLIEAGLIFKYFPHRFFIQKFFESKLRIYLKLENSLERDHKNIKIIKIGSNDKVEISSVINDNNTCNIFEIMKCIYKDTFRNIDYYYQEIDYQYLYTILMFKLVEKYEEKIVKVDKIYVKLFSHLYLLYHRLYNLYDRNSREEYNLLEYLEDIELFLKGKIEKIIIKLVDEDLNTVLDDVLNFIYFTKTYYKKYLEILDLFKEVVEKYSEFEDLFKTLEHSIELKLKLIININYKWIIISNILIFPPIYLCSALPLILLNPIPLLSISFEFNWYSLIKEQLRILNIGVKDADHVDFIESEKIEKIENDFLFKNNILTCLKSPNFKVENFIEKEYDILKKKSFYSKKIIKDDVITDIRLRINPLRHSLIFAHGPFHIFLLNQKIDVYEIKESILQNAYTYFTIISSLEKYFINIFNEYINIITNELEHVQFNIKDYESSIDKNKIDELIDYIKDISSQIKTYIMGRETLNRLNGNLKHEEKENVFSIIKLAKNILEVSNYQQTMRLFNLINEWLFETTIIDIFYKC